MRDQEQSGKAESSDQQKKSLLHDSEKKSGDRLISSSGLLPGDQNAAANTMMVLESSSDTPEQPKLDKPSQQVEETKDGVVEAAWGHKIAKLGQDDTIYTFDCKNEGVTARRMQISILVKDFNRLEPSVYLNDTLVLFFLKFFQNYVLEKAVSATVHIFNSFFMQMIT